MCIALFYLPADDVINSKVNLRTEKTEIKGETKMILHSFNKALFDNLLDSQNLRH